MRDLDRRNPEPSEVDEPFEPDGFTSLGTAISLSLGAFTASLCVIGLWRVLTLGVDAFLWIYALTLVPISIDCFVMARETYQTPRSKRAPLSMVGVPLLGAVAIVLSRQMSSAAGINAQPSLNWIALTLALAFGGVYYEWWRSRRGV
jgi:hypothetical protein